MSSITKMTTQGRALLAAAVANSQGFPSAKIIVGDGNGSMYVPDEAQVALVHQLWIGNATVARTDDRVIFQAVVPPEIGGFTVREVGVLIGAVGSEQLFIISQHPSTEKIAAPANGSGPLPITIAFSASASEQAVLPIGSSDNATLQLSRAPHITVDDLVTAPPGSPVDGTMYAIDTGATGVFVGKGGWLVERVAGTWIYTLPPEKSVIRLTTNGNWYQRNAGDWVALTFDDTAILWAQITDPPSTFPPATHNHDDRYFTETESDGRYVLKAGDTMTGTLLAPNIRAGAATGANAQAILSGADTYVALESVQADTPATKKNLALAPWGGNVAIGSTTPGAKLDINGDLLLRGNILGPWSGHQVTIGADPAGTITAGGFIQFYGQTHAVAPGEVRIGSGGVERLSIVAGGALKLSSVSGANGQVISANASGIAMWKTLAELGAGKKIIAIGSASTGSVITFPNPEADTTYSGVCWNGVGTNSAVNGSTLGVGSITSKTTTTCVVNSANTELVAANPVFYIIYR